ncbi:MAG: ABC transporter permease subunit, partial [Pseudomonadota bacterium]
AIFATILGAFISIPAALLCSRNLVPYAPLRAGVRRTLEAIRTLPDIIVAMILVAAFGIGPLAGVITIVLSTVGRLGKLFSEINENADMRQLEGIRSSGGNWWDQIRYGLFPQVAPGYASYAMLKFEGNISAAAALGIVGAGGIGIELARAITYTQFTDYLAILLMMTVLIFAIDIASEAIRHRLIGVKVASA